MCGLFTCAGDRAASLPQWGFSFVRDRIRAEVNLMDQRGLKNDSL
ncbi:hypothetical protein HPDFL43_00024890 [Hoeflea phototrophica DFL-43]|uniref:Uncharacterized protein n=1 Tax=Hoeflea phototrophica (strain DSM 17068 / NCIMB 14078 / DFL-43) TaxID=411684 RepID=A0A094Z0E3_HOEPD|nr:hypothetical protein HPDFL43_00024890 [Hoeflea phototrophica DFL-43]